MGKYLLSGYNLIYPDSKDLSSPSLNAKIAYDKTGGLTLKNYGKVYFCMSWTNGKPRAKARYSAKKITLHCCMGASNEEPGDGGAAIPGQRGRGIDETEGAGKESPVIRGKGP
jgi:hypothetical protein